MFNSILEGAASGNLSAGSALILLGVSLLCGFIIALTALYTGRCSKGFAASLVVLPAIVEIVILAVNGNLGTGVVVVGAFSLVRFRSAQGSSREICLIFLAMAAGLLLGMGYALFAVVSAAAVCAIIYLLHITSFGERRGDEKSLRVTLPEDLDYEGRFDEVLKTYTRSHTLESVKTTNLGSMFELQFTIVEKNIGREKEMLDALRCLNGNLPIHCSRRAPRQEEL